MELRSRSLSEQNKLQGTEEETAKGLSETQTVSLIKNNSSFLQCLLVSQNDLISNDHRTSERF